MGTTLAIPRLTKMGTWHLRLNTNRDDQEKATRSLFFNALWLLMKQVVRIYCITMPFNTWFLLKSKLSKFASLEPKPVHTNASTPLLQLQLFCCESPLVKIYQSCHNLRLFAALSLAPLQILFWARANTFGFILQTIQRQWNGFKKIQKNSFGANASKHEPMQWFKPVQEKEGNEDCRVVLGVSGWVAWVRWSEQEEGGVTHKPAWLLSEVRASCICMSLALTFLWFCHLLKFTDFLSKNPISVWRVLQLKLNNIKIKENTRIIYLWRPSLKHSKCKHNLPELPISTSTPTHHLTSPPSQL